ncbi:hypothetical protein P3S67_017313 [Capsicum chacoense]
MTIADSLFHDLVYPYDGGGTIGLLLFPGHCMVYSHRNLETSKTKLVIPMKLWNNS